MKNVKNLSGRKVNNIFVISICDKRDNQNKILWNCICDCGKEIKIRTYDLTKGKIKSCGCKTLNKNINVSLNQKYATYRRDAINRGLSFDLSKDNFYDLMKKNCEYCGSTPEEYSPYIDKNGKILDKYIKLINNDYISTTIVKINGIDRIINDEGYTLKNCITCCKICNLMKNKYSYDKFINHIKRIYEFNNLIGKGH